MQARNSQNIKIYDRFKEIRDKKFSALSLDLTVIQIFYKRAERHAKIISNRDTLFLNHKETASTHKKQKRHAILASSLRTKEHCAQQKITTDSQKITRCALKKRKGDNISHVRKSQLLRKNKCIFRVFRGFTTLTLIGFYIFICISDIFICY